MTIAGIAERHVMGDAFDGPICNECRDVWPCDASILAALLTPERLAAALRTIPVPATYEEWQAAVDRFYESDATLILAALEAQP